MAFCNVFKKVLVSGVPCAQLTGRLDVISATGGIYVDGSALAAAELTYIDGVTAGTAAVSKALVLDSAGKISFASITPPYASNENAFISVGTYTTAMTVANTSAYSFIPIQVNLSSTGNVSSAGQQVAAMRLRVDTDTGNGQNTAIAGLQIRSDLGASCYAYCGLSQSANISANITTEPGEFQVAFWQITGAGNIACTTGNVSVIEARMAGTGTGVDYVGLFSVNTAATLTSVIKANVGAGTVTNGIEIAGTMTTGLAIGSGTTNAITFGAGAGKIVDAAASLSIYGGGTTGDALVLQGSSADAGQKITITGATGTTIIGNVTLGASGTETVTFTAKLGSQLYHNLSDTAYTVLKIHNHDTTAEIGGLETKGDLINTTGTVAGETASWTYEPTGGTGTPAGVSASSNVLAVSSGFTVTTGNIYALHGEAQLYGTLNGATVNVAGVIGVVGGNGANTQVLHMAGVQSAMSTGLVNPTTGTLSYYLANSLSTVVVDNLICSLQSQYITNFASFDAAATDKCIEAATSNMGVAATAYCLRILVEGVPMYIPVYDNKTWS